VNRPFCFARAFNLSEAAEPDAKQKHAKPVKALLVVRRDRD
jgi:hypothetical protein